MATFASRAEVTIAGRSVDTHPDHLGELTRSAMAEGFEALRARFAQDGYLYLPGFHPREEVAICRASIIAQLEPEGIFDPQYPAASAHLKEGVDMAFRPDIANTNPDLPGLLYGERMMALASGLVGEPAMHYDYTWLRAVGTGRSTMPHYDIVYMGRGTNQLFTCWTPLADLAIENGVLAILEGSHQAAELKSTYGTMDVDTVCTNKSGVKVVDDRGYVSFGALPDHPDALRQVYGRRWLTNPFAMGDVLLFGMYTLHASTDNHTPLLRLSTDSRYQAASLPADPRWIGENPVGHGEAAQVGMIC